MIGAISCPHIADIDQNKFQQQFSEDAEHKNRILECYICERTGQNLWMCLHNDCFKIFCSDLSPNHVLCHYKRDSTHCLHMNLSNLRFWCQECNGKIMLQKDDMDTGLTPRGLVGLQNLGNTCYLSAALQALAHTPPLADYFIEAASGNGLGPPGCNIFAKSGPLSAAFGRLLCDLWSRPAGYIAPAAVLHAIRHSHPMYRGFQQHDSQEFLRCLLDQLHEEMKVPTLETLRQFNYGSEQEEDISDFEDGSDKEEYETCDSGVSERSSLSEEPLQKMSVSRSSSPVDKSPRKIQVHLNPLGTPNKPKKQVIYKSIVSEVFDGTLLSSVQCLTCNRVSSRVETFQDLSLPIPGRETIYILHRGNMNQITNGPHKCAHLVSADQGWFSWFWDWVCSWLWGPQVSLHDCLSAFFSADELKGDNMYSCEKCGKLRNGVKYSRLLSCPEVLCIHLKRFRHDPSLPSKISCHVSFPLTGLDLSPYLETGEARVGVTKYDLVSVICHHGQGGASGHYTCLAKNRDTGFWYEYDDHCVKPASNVTSSRAYVLFYRKDNSKANRARKRASRFEELSSGEKQRYYICKEWLVKFHSFSDPGPVDNRLLLCQHDALVPGAETVVLSATVWKYLVTRYGGGPEVAVDKYAPCELCSQLSGEPHLLRLQFHEFSRLQDEGSGSYHISMAWLSAWEAFIKGQSGESPGPVTTTGPTCVVSSGQWDLLTGLYGTQDAQGSPKSHALDEKGSLGNMDSGIWVQNSGDDKGTSSENWSVEMPRDGN